MVRTGLGLLLLVAACERPAPPPEPPPPSPAPTARPAPGPEAPQAPAAADQGPGPVPLLRATATARDAGDEQVLGKDGETEVAPSARFRLEVAVPLADARLVLLDPQEALVPAETAAEIGTAASRFSLSPSRPLRPGARYALRLEGASGRELHDLAGRGYRPVSVSVRAAGEPPPPEPKRAAKKRRKRR